MLSWQRHKCFIILFPARFRNNNSYTRSYSISAIEILIRYKWSLISEIKWLIVTRKILTQNEYCEEKKFDGFSWRTMVSSRDSDPGNKKTWKQDYWVGNIVINLPTSFLTWNHHLEYWRFQVEIDVSEFIMMYPS